MKCEVLAKSLWWKEVMILLKRAWQDLSNTHPFFPNKDTIPNFVESKKPSATDLFADQHNFYLAQSLVSSPVSFSLMDTNDIVLSNLRSSLEKNSVSHLGSTLREFGAFKMCHWDWDQIPRHAFERNLKLKCFIVLVSHIESLVSLPHVVCHQPLNETFL